MHHYWPGYIRFIHHLLDERNIRYRNKTKGRSPLVASTTDGVVMQVLINLFDNAAYWLESAERDAREILVTVDGDRGQLVFSDTGPGIDRDDLPYIFDAFYSGKGQEGRGLGLYIARQLLERHDYRIGVADTEDSGIVRRQFHSQLREGGFLMDLKDILSGIGVVIDDALDPDMTTSTDDDPDRIVHICEPVRT